MAGVELSHVVPKAGALGPALRLARQTSIDALREA